MQQGQTQQPAGQRGQAPGGRGQQAPAGRGGGGGGRGGGRGYDGMPAEVPDEYNAAPIMVLEEPALIDILNNSSSTLFQKAIACKKLATIGTSASIALMAALLGEERLGHYARFGLEPNPDPAVDDALREALGRLSGPRLVGVIHSIGVRKDAEAVGALAVLLSNSDPAVAQAAASSLSLIGGDRPAEILEGMLGSARPPLLPVVARAALACAYRMSANNRATARQMFNALTADNMPRPVRKAAFRRLLAIDAMDAV